MNAPLIQRIDLTWSSISSTGFTSAKPLVLAGRSGRVLAVKLRMDTNGTAVSGSVYIGDTDFSTTPDDLDIAYQSSSVGFSDSGTAASFGDALTAPAPYHVADVGDLRAAINVDDAGASSSTFHLTIYVEVYG